MRRREQADLEAYLTIGDDIFVRATGRYVSAEPDVDWPEGIEDLTVFFGESGKPYPEEDLSENDEALCIEALLDYVHRQDEE